MNSNQATGISKEVCVMERTITIGNGISNFTLKPGDKAVIVGPQIGYGHGPPRDRKVVMVSRVLGSESAPYVEVRDGNATRLFNLNGTERGVGFHDSHEHLEPFISDEHEQALNREREQWHRRRNLATRIVDVFGELRKADRIIHAHPELVDELEAILNKIEGAKR